jgi:1-acyl-sn-glycerol-3-phosphate acyltransferase
VREVTGKMNFKIAYLNSVFYILFFLFSAIFIPLMTLVVAAQALFASFRYTMKRFRRSISLYGAVIIRILPFPFIRVHYRDLDRSGHEGPFMFVSNHRSFSDPFLMATLPYECIQVVNTWPFRIPVLGIFAKWAGYLSIRQMPPEAFSRRSAELLEQGVSIIAFPEGTRSGGQEMGQFHGSVFRVALETHCAIAPLCVSGNEHIPRKGSLWLRPGVINVYKLPTLTWEDYRDLDPYKLKNLVRDMMAEKLAEMDAARVDLPSG